MIDGIRIEVSPEDLKDFLELAARRAEASVVQWRERIVAHERQHADTVAPTKGFLSAQSIEATLGKKSDRCEVDAQLQAALKTPQARVEMFRYAAAHLPTEPAHLTLNELDLLMVGA